MDAHDVVDTSWYFSVVTIYQHCHLDRSISPDNTAQCAFCPRLQHGTLLWSLSYLSLYKEWRCNYITERSVRWYYGLSIAAASARRPLTTWTLEHSTNIQPSSFKLYEGRYPLRYFAIEMWYPPMTRTTAFAAKRHSYPPNLKNAISP